VALPLSYAFTPGESRDGVTVDVPLSLLHHLDAADFGWQVPGLRLDLVTELIRSLPKPLRRRLVPAPDHAARVVASLRPGADGLLSTLASQLLRETGVQVSPTDFDVEHLPDHLRLTFRVVDDDGREVAAGKDLRALQEQLRERLRATLSSAARGIERSGLRDWGDLGELPRTVSTTRAGHTVTGYPALSDGGDQVSVRVYESPSAQAAAMRAGTRRLVRLTTPSPLAPVVRALDNRTKLALGHNPYGSVPALLDDCADCACDHLVAAAGGPAWDTAGFARLRDAVRADLVPATEQVVGQVTQILETAHDVRIRLDTVTAPGLAAVRDDVEVQLDELVPIGFVSRTGWTRLPDVLRYLGGVRQRLDRLADDPRRDLARLDEILAVVTEYERARDAVPADTPTPPELDEARWLLEELRLGLFAPSVRASRPASVKRVRRVLEAAARPPR
jgi:ATP-dependent helicase HrpA